MVCCGASFRGCAFEDGAMLGPNVYPKATHLAISGCSDFHEIGKLCFKMFQPVFRLHNDYNQVQTSLSRICQ